MTVWLLWYSPGGEPSLEGVYATRFGAMAAADGVRWKKSDQPGALFLSEDRAWYITRQTVKP